MYSGVVRWDRWADICPLPIPRGQSSHQSVVDAFRFIIIMHKFIRGKLACESTEKYCLFESIESAHRCNAVGPTQWNANKITDNNNRVLRGVFVNSERVDPRYEYWNSCIWKIRLSGGTDCRTRLIGQLHYTISRNTLTHFFFCWEYRGQKKITDVEEVSRGMGKEKELVTTVKRKRLYLGRIARRKYRYDLH